MSIFNRGCAFTGVLVTANLDLRWHTAPIDTIIGNVSDFEKTALEKTGLWIKEILSKYRSPRFAYIFGDGYGAGYYSYQWIEILCRDAYQWSEEDKGFTRTNGQRLRELILSKGNTMDYERIYLDFRGKAPIIEPLFEARGLK